MASGYFGMPSYFILKWKGDKILTVDFEVFLPMIYRVSHIELCFMNWL